MTSRSVAIVIPVFNEEAVIEQSIREVLQYAAIRFKSFEIIVIDDGSTDKTNAILKSLTAEIPSLTILRNERNRGKGFGVRRGVLSASSEFILVSDADLSTPICNADRLLEALKPGVDIAIGSRNMRAQGVVVKRSFHRRLMGRAFNLMVRNLVIKGILDTQCGFKLFKADVARKIFERVRIEGFGFDVEVLCLADHFGMEVKEIPVEWVASQRTAVRLVRDSFRMFIDLIVVRKRWRNKTF